MSVLEETGGGFMKRQKQTENEDRQELRHLKRQEILELLLEQTRRADTLEQHVKELEQHIKELEEQLENRDITVRKAGTLAEAALQINKVFEAADAAARQYYMNVMRLTDLTMKQNEKE